MEVCLDVFQAPRPSPNARGVAIVAANAVNTRHGHRGLSLPDQPSILGHNATQAQLLRV